MCLHSTSSHHFPLTIVTYQPLSLKPSSPRYLLAVTLIEQLLSPFIELPNTIWIISYLGTFILIFADFQLTTSRPRQYIFGYFLQYISYTISFGSCEQANRPLLADVQMSEDFLLFCPQSISQV